MRGEILLRNVLRHADTPEPDRGIAVIALVRWTRAMPPQASRASRVRRRHEPAQRRSTPSRPATRTDGPGSTGRPTPARRGHATDDLRRRRKRNGASRILKSTNCGHTWATAPSATTYSNP